MIWDNITEEVSIDKQGKKTKIDVLGHWNITKLEMKKNASYRNGETTQAEFFKRGRGAWCPWVSGNKSSQRSEWSAIPNAAKGSSRMMPNNCFLNLTT